MGQKCNLPKVVTCTKLGTECCNPILVLLRNRGATPFDDVKLVCGCVPLVDDICARRNNNVLHCVGNELEVVAPESVQERNGGKERKITPPLRFPLHHPENPLWGTGHCL